MILHIYKPEVKIERSPPPKNDLIVICLVFWRSRPWIRRSCLNRVVITSLSPSSCCSSYRRSFCKASIASSSLIRGVLLICFCIAIWPGVELRYVFNKRGCGRRVFSNAQSQRIHTNVAFEDFKIWA